MKEWMKRFYVGWVQQTKEIHWSRETETFSTNVEGAEAGLEKAVCWDIRLFEREDVLR